MGTDYTEAWQRGDVEGDTCGRVCGDFGDVEGDMCGRVCGDFGDVKTKSYL